MTTNMHPTQLDVSFRPDTFPASGILGNINFGTPVLRANVAGISLPNVLHIDGDKIGDLFQIPTPTKDSTEAQLFDMLGAHRILTITGFIAADYSDVTAMCNTLWQLISGNQQEFLYVDTVITGSVKCLCARVKINTTAPGLRAKYIITLWEGTVGIEDDEETA